MSYITVCWLNSVKELRLRYTSFFVSFLAFGAVLAPTARGGEPVFNMQAAPVRCGADFQFAQAPE